MCVCVCMYVCMYIYIYRFYITLVVQKDILVTSPKMLQSDWLLKCRDIVIVTLRGAKTIFLDT